MKYSTWFDIVRTRRDRFVNDNPTGVKYKLIVYTNRMTRSYLTSGVNIPLVPPNSRNNLETSRETIILFDRLLFQFYWYNIALVLIQFIIIWYWALENLLLIKVLVSMETFTNYYNHHLRSYTLFIWYKYVWKKHMRRQEFHQGVHIIVYSKYV